LEHDLSTELDELRQRLEQAENAINTLVRTQVAQGLAQQFFTDSQPYKKQPELAALLQEGLLKQPSFIQKPPHLLELYRWLFAAMETPRSILEIGVKGGGSTALWKALFPSATVVGMDIKLRPWLRAQPSEDGVVYLKGDQTDVERLREISAAHGPFDLVIDDGSHVTDHQETTLRALLLWVRPGGFYVIEDIHASIKQSEGGRVKYGADIWADFTVAVLQQLRRAPFEPATPGARLGVDLAKRIDQLIVARRALAIRAKALG
jgi:cephalosporin hydroxylase